MVSGERGSGGSPDRHSRHITAINQFDRNLDSMIHPVSREGLRDVTWKLLIGMLEYTPKEASTYTEMLDDKGDIPDDDELEYSTESIAEVLKFNLFHRLAEEYMIIFGEEEFSRWVEPFLWSVLKGHLEGSSSYEHEGECTEKHEDGYYKRFCPARIMKLMVKDMLCECPTPIDQNVGYLPYSQELIFMNVTIVKTLQKYGIYSEAETEKLLGEYMWWLESEKEPLSYDAELFDF